MKLAFESVDSVRQIVLPSVGGQVQSTKSLNSRKGRRRNLYFFASFMVDLEHLIFSCCGTEIYTMGSPGSQVLGLRMNYATIFPGSPGCKQQIMGLFSLQNCMSQFLVINFHYTHTHICMYVFPIYLFLWKSQTNIDFGTNSGSKGIEFYGFYQLVLGFLELVL